MCKIDIGFSSDGCQSPVRSILQGFYGKAWLLLSRKPFSDSRRWEAVNSILGIFTIAVWIYMCMQSYIKIVI